MKKELVSSFLVAVFGVIVAYIATNIFMTEPEEVTYKTVDASSLSADLAEPDDKIFNYLALNPTVEVYIGDCEEYDLDGGCSTESLTGQALQQQRARQKENIGYYDVDGYFHQYEITDEGFYDYDGYYFRFEGDGYYDEDGHFYRFDDAEKGYFDGSEFLKELDENEKSEEDEKDTDESDEGFFNRLNRLVNGDEKRSSEDE